MSVVVTVIDTITVVTIDCAPVRNAVDRGTAAALADAFRAFDVDDSSPVTILTGAGGTFCAGADLNLILTGRAVHADEALAIGLANRVVPAGQALIAALDLAREIASFPQARLRSDRRSAIDQHHLDRPAAIRHELELGAAVLPAASDTIATFVDGAGRHGAPLSASTTSSAAPAVADTA